MRFFLLLLLKNLQFHVAELLNQWKVVFMSGSAYLLPSGYSFLVGGPATVSF